MDELVNVGTYIDPIPRPSYLYSDLNKGKEIVLTINHNRVKRKLYLTPHSQNALLFARVIDSDVTSSNGTNRIDGIAFYVRMDYPYDKPIDSYHNQKWRKAVNKAIIAEVGGAYRVQFLAHYTDRPPLTLSYSLKHIHTY